MGDVLNTQPMKRIDCIHLVMLHKTSHKGLGDEKASKSKEKLDGSQLDEDGIRDLSGDNI